jgi:ADP-ribose pyrophosphatase YjhB (NUDIX family)
MGNHVSESVHPAVGSERFCSSCGGSLSVKGEGGRMRPWCAACNRFVFGRFSVGVGGFLTHCGRVLLVQRGREPGRGRWTFPGGFLEEDEAPDEGLAREVFEETGLRVRVEGLLALRHAQTDSEQNVYCVYRLSLAGPVEDLAGGGDGDEVTRVVFAAPEEFASLGEIGGVTRWLIERAGGGTGLLKTVRTGFPVVASHRWSVLLVPSGMTDWAQG